MKIELIKSSLLFKMDLLNPIHLVQFWSNYINKCPQILIAIPAIIKLKEKGVRKKHFKKILFIIILWIIYFLTPYSAGGFPGNTKLLIHNFRYSFPAMILTIIISLIILEDKKIPQSKRGKENRDISGK